MEGYMKIKQILYIIGFIAIFEQSSAMQAPEQDNKTDTSIKKLLKEKVKEKFKNLFARPKFKIEKPLEIIKTPTKTGSIEIEAENVIERLDEALYVRELTRKAIIKCSVIITNQTDKFKLIHIFKQKKFNPRNLTFERIPLEEIKIAIEVRIDDGKKRKAKL